MIGDGTPGGMSMGATVYGKTPQQRDDTGRTPMYSSAGAKTPMYGSQTPMYGSQTPMHGGGQTPMHGSQTPMHEGGVLLSLFCSDYFEVFIRLKLVNVDCYLIVSID
ncbi:unnamed protein product [Anisakis simplex]|uniref:Transcription elongation factor SPT5 (inferred by orthology to a C. elegans protein) n=1 Tax=Anisakis simplex TaxID=6269 RepID=A0A0M3JPF5_ANISI|nr:unnamed protein product [Anisakis simplex]